ncbi:MAG: Uma2 family endonuclease, partial [Acidobacteriota bacterium]|nr:Uma2 family endonuclease [Acidobacteriota bacterium]
MATPAALMTVDEFLELPEKEGIRQELSDGVLIEEEIEKLGYADGRHERVKANFNEILVVFAEHQKLWLVFPVSNFKLGNSARIPDVSLVS